jgi:hypothetical protein
MNLTNTKKFPDKQKIILCKHISSTVLSKTEKNLSLPRSSKKIISLGVEINSILHFLETLKKSEAVCLQKIS